MDGLQGVRQLTQQMIQLLQRMDPTAYQQAVDIYDGVSVGKHFRHIFDFYKCLIEGLAQGKVDYSNRSRDLEIEREPLAAAHHFNNALHQLNELSMEESIRVLSDFSDKHQVERVAYTSTVGREMAFIHDHTVHHLAIIKMGIKRINPNFPLTENFGVAPSTLRLNSN